MTIKQAVVFALIACSLPQFSHAQGGSLEGAWRVSEVVVTGANASTNRSPQPGLFLFTGRHYSIVTVNGTAPRKETAAAANPAQLTDAEKLARYEAWRPFTANSGTYEVSATTLTTRPLVAKNPNAMGTSTTWERKIEGNTLTLVLRSGANQPASEQRITLTRIE